ncbi:MAG: rRNA maturation RNase YbeY [bacterium]|nr:rRNA maturation RNase YbeY [bacterium]MCX7917742.1 rRNA maturation RNase YbeY [bacterium]MDW8163892.1 rRNA maturation RNase YbeY [Candidatus Omnitrophota bacterium]
MDEEFLNSKIEKIQKILNPPPTKISIYFVNNKVIRSLNKKFFKKDSPTDVISFKYSPNYGEIVLSIEECGKNAQIYSHTLEEEIIYVIIHGILHLKGFRDYNIKEKRKMFTIQDRIFEKVMKNEK